MRLALALALVALTVVGCGGDDDASTSTTVDGDVTKASAVACLNDARIEVAEDKPTSPHMLGVLYINEDQLNQVYVAFMDSPEAATEIQQGLTKLSATAGGNAGAELVGDEIVLARARDTDQRRRQPSEELPDGLDRALSFAPATRS